MTLALIVLFIGVFAAGLLTALALVPLAGRIGIKVGMADVPGPRKVHAKVMPRSGGLAIYASFVGCLVGAAAGAWFIGRHASFLPDTLRTLCGNVPIALKPLGGILVGATMIFVLGIVDDIKPLGPKLKLFLQIASVVPLIMGGVSIKLFLPFPWMGWILTAVWVVALTNSFNFLDNMDGLCAGVSAIISGVLFVISVLSHEWYMALVFILLAGTLTGYLKYNFHPASIFMGDCGSTTIGYLLGALTCVATYYQQGVPSGFPVLMPLVVLGVPLFDTISVMSIRYRTGKPFMVGDTNHFSHRLRRLGMSVRETAVFIYITTLAIGLSALPLRYLPLEAAIIHTALIAVLFVLIYLLERAGRLSKNS